MTLSSFNDLQNQEIQLYDAYTKKPFIVFLRYCQVDRSQKSLSVLKVAQGLTKANIKFSDLRKYFWNTWRLEFDDRSAANSVLRNKYIKEKSFVMYIPWFMLQRNGVIRDFDLEELKESIENESSYARIERLFRLKRRDSQSGSLVDTRSVYVVFRRSELPKEVKMWKCIIEVTPYISAVRICFRCSKFGHTSKFCNGEEKCLSCASFSFKNLNCSAKSFCINCKGEHKTLNKACPSLNKNREIMRKMTYDNLPFMDARRSVQNWKWNTSEPSRDIKKFLRVTTVEEVSFL